MGTGENYSRDDSVGTWVTQAKNCKLEKIAKLNQQLQQQDQDLRIFLNKAIINEETEKEWLILVFQDPHYSVQTLIQEAMNNPGKVSLGMWSLSSLKL